MTSLPEKVVPSPANSAYLLWQDGVQGSEAADKAIGPAIVLEVNTGDEIGLETWVRFKHKTTYTRDFDLLALSALLGHTLAGAPGFDGVDPTQVATNLNGGLGSFGFGSDDTDDTRPYAYLNYVLFRDDYTVVDAGWRRVPPEGGFDPGEEGLPGMHQRLAFDDPVVAGENGYLYVWVSNESENTQVWFDDLRVSHTGTFVAQATDYGAWGDVIREQKTDEGEYRYGYQGQYSERDEETGYNAFESRMYDPIVGRWTTMDPARVGFSPYIGMGNNPIQLVDPDGMEPLDDWKLKNDGTYELMARTDDNFHRFFNADGKLIFQTNWAKDDIGNAIAAWGGVNPGGEWLDNFRSLIRTFNLDKNIWAVEDMLARAERLNFEMPSTMWTSAERARNADMIDLALSFFDLKPTKGYRPGVAPIKEGVKMATGMPAGKYFKSLFWKFLMKLHTAPAWDPNDPKDMYKPVMIR